MSSFLDFIKNAFSYQRLELHSPLAVDETLTRLNENIKPKNNSLVYEEDPFYGVVTNHDFKITRDIYRGDSSDLTPNIPIIKGSVEENVQGSVIKIAIKANMIFILFVIVWSIAATLFMTGSNYLLIIMITLAMFCAFAVFTTLEPHVEAGKIKKFLSNILGKKEVSFTTITFLEFIKNLPYNRFEVYSTLTVEEVIDRLKANIKPERTNIGYKFQGIVTHHRFQMSRDVSYEDSLDSSDGKTIVPVIKGSVTGNGQGSIIKFVIISKTMMVVLAVIWLGWISLITFTEISNNKNVCYAVLAAFLFFSMFPTLSFHIEAKKAKKFLCDTLDAKEV